MDPASAAWERWRQTGQGIIWIAALIAICYGGSLFAQARLGGSWLAAGVGIATIIAFLGILRVFRNVGDGVRPFDESSMRHAIGGSIIVLYILTLATSTFTDVEPTTDFGEELVQSFHDVVKITVAFYLGSSAVAEGAKALATRVQ